MGVSPGGEHVLWGGDGTDAPGLLATLGPDGELRELTDPAPEDARLRGWWLAPARDWRIDAGGRAHLPVAGPDAVAILRLTG